MVDEVVCASSEHIAAFHNRGGAEDGFGGVVGAGVAPLRNNAGRGERRDADSADGVIHHNDFTEDGSAMSGVVVVDAGDNANACGDKVFMVERPASLHVDKADAAAVGLRPSPAHVDAGGCGVFVMLIGVARIVDGIDRRRNRAGFDIGSFNAGPQRDLAGDRFRIHSGRTFDDSELSETRRNRVEKWRPRLR